MHRTDADGYAPGNLFQEGAPGTGLLAAKVGAKWLNNLQAEFLSVLAAAGITPNDANNGQVLEAVGLLFSSSNASAVLKNKLINGGFELWQRGTSIALSNVLTFTADRWAGSADTLSGGTATVSRQSFAYGQTLVSGGPRHYLRWTQTLAATASPILFQPIEDVARYSSGKITVSFWARGSDNLTAATRCFQVFGTGGSSSVTVGTASIAITTVWQKFTATYTLPSVLGKTIGPLNFLRVGLSLPLGATYTIDVADFQVEVGENATAFDRRPSQVEYLLAARYFEKSYALDTAPGTADRTGALHRGGAFGPIGEARRLQERFRVTKRAAPSVVWYAPLGSAAPFAAGSGKVSASNDPGSPFFAYAGVPVLSTNGTTEEFTGWPKVSTDFTGWTSGPTPFVQGTLCAHWTASAELV